MTKTAMQAFSPPDPDGAQATGPQTHTPAWLPLPVFAGVVQNAPLVSLDLVVMRGSGPSAQMLLGMRRNRPAQGYWFAPGGRIHKGESLNAAMQRTVQAELGLSLAALAHHAGQPVQPQWLGVYEHFYADSFPDPAVSTHYVVLAHTLQWPAALSVPAPPGQHSQWQWWAVEQVAHSPQVHPNTQAYARALLGAVSSHSHSNLSDNTVSEFQGANT